MKGIAFELSKAEQQKIENWKANLPEATYDVWGKKYCYEYVFYPTGLGVIKQVRRTADGAVLDLTDYSCW